MVTWPLDTGGIEIAWIKSWYSSDCGVLESFDIQIAESVQTASSTVAQDCLRGDIVPEPDGTSMILAGPPGHIPTVPETVLEDFD